MKIYLVRHAQSLNNESSDVDFGPDSGLSQTGIEQSKRLGLFLRDKKFDVIYCSKFGRAVHTLNQIRPYINCQNIVFTEDLNERSKGLLKSREDYAAALKASGLKDHQFRPPGGENYADVEKRAQNFLGNVFVNYKKENILIVGHGIFLRLLILRLLRLHMREMAYFDLHNASISIFEIEAGKIKDFDLNLCTHLLKNSSYDREVTDQK